MCETCFYCKQSIERNPVFLTWWDQMDVMQMSGYHHQECLDFTADLHKNLAYDEGVPYPESLGWQALIRARGKHLKAYRHIMARRLSVTMQNEAWSDPVA